MTLNITKHERDYLIQLLEAQITQEADDLLRKLREQNLERKPKSNIGIDVSQRVIIILTSKEKEAIEWVREHRELFSTSDIVHSLLDMGIEKLEL